MLRKCFELLGLIESKKTKPVWVINSPRGTLDGVLLMRVIAHGQKKWKGPGN